MSSPRRKKELSQEREFMQALGHVRFAVSLAEELVENLRKIPNDGTDEAREHHQRVMGSAENKLTTSRIVLVNLLASVLFAPANEPAAASSEPASAPGMDGL